MNPEMDAINLVIVYRIIRLISLPWAELSKDSPDILERFCYNLKRLIEKTPEGATKLNSYSNALSLISEGNADPSPFDSIFENLNEQELNELLRMHCLDLVEDAPANNVGGGQIAGLGVGPQGEPPMPLKKKRIKRFLDFKETET